MSKIKFYTKNIPVEDDMQALKQLAFLYSSWRVSVGEVKSTLSEKFITLLAMYLKYGYCTAAKKKAIEFMGVTPSSIDNMNHNLKEFGYLIDDRFNGRNKFLHPSLINLKDNYELTVKAGQPVLFIFKIDMK